MLSIIIFGIIFGSRFKEFYLQVASEFKSYVIKSVLKSDSFKIDYDEIEPVFINKFLVKNLRISNSTNTVKFISIAETYIDFDLIRIISDSSSPIKEITINGINVYLNKEFIDNFNNGNKTDSFNFKDLMNTINPGFDIKISNVNIQSDIEFFNNMNLSFEYLSLIHRDENTEYNIDKFKIKDNANNYEINSNLGFNLENNQIIYAANVGIKESAFNYAIGLNVNGNINENVISGKLNTDLNDFGSEFSFDYKHEEIKSSFNLRNIVITRYLKSANKSIIDFLNTTKINGRGEYTRKKGLSNIQVQIDGEAKIGEQLIQVINLDITTDFNKVKLENTYLKILDFECYLSGEYDFKNHAVLNYDISDDLANIGKFNLKGIINTKDLKLYNSTLELLLNNISLSKGNLIFNSSSNLVELISSFNDKYFLNDSKLDITINDKIELNLIAYTTSENLYDYIAGFQTKENFPTSLKLNGSYSLVDKKVTNLEGFFQYNTLQFETVYNEKNNTIKIANNGSEVFSSKYNINFNEEKILLNIDKTQNFPEFSLDIAQNLEFIEFNAGSNFHISCSRLNDTYSGSIRAESVPFQLSKNEKFQFSTYGVFRISDLNNYSLSLPNLYLISNFSNLNQPIVMTTSVFINQDLQKLEDLRIVYNGYYLDGIVESKRKDEESFQISGSFGQKNPSQDDPNLINPFLNINGIIGLNPSKISINYSLVNFDLAKTKVKSIEGQMNSSGKIIYNLEGISLDGSLVANNLYLGGLKTEFSCLYSFKSNENLYISNLKARYLDSDISFDQINIRPGFDAFDFAGKIKIPNSKLPFEINGDFSNKVNSESQFTIKNIPGNNNNILSLVFGVKVSNKGIQLTEKNKIFEGFIRENNNFEFTVNDPFIFSSNINGRLSLENIDVSVSNFKLSLNNIKDFTNFNVFSLFSGELKGDFRVSGSLSNPVFYGALKANKLVGNISFNQDKLNISEVNIILNKNLIIIPPMIVKNGSSIINTTGEILLDRFSFVKYNFVFTPDELNPLNLNYNFGPIRIVGQTTGAINISGIGNTTTIQGNIGVKNAQVSLAQSNNYSGSSSEESYYKIDLGITMLKNVTFIYPNPDFPIIRASFDRNQKLDIIFDSKTGYYQLLGKMLFKNGDFRNSFYIKKASVLFSEISPKFDPVLDLESEARVNVNDISYKISLIINNQNLSKLNPVLSSTPFLSKEILEGFLTTGTISNETKGIGDIAYLGTDLLSNIGVLRNLESNIRNLLDLDVFSLKSGLISSLVKGVVEDQPLDISTNSFGKYFDNTSLVVGKYITNELYFEALTQIKSLNGKQVDLYPLGVKLEFELGFQLSLPFMDLEWRFAPKNSEDLFVRDNSFSFSWKLE